jgi:Na+-translocating ferredoxin:NAD+ oxidoreductase subunit B
MKRKPVATEEIDSLLPQTQCGLCSYDGCLPYADAIAYKNESLSLCPPGGVEGMQALGNLVGEDVSPFIASMELKTKPPLLAVIREHECIGCTKCIQACPVDAIMGASKQMHTVINDECTGCELCVEPCPVDCIDLIEFDPYENQTKNQRAIQFRNRYRNRNQRLADEQIAALKKHQQAKFSDQATQDPRSAKKAAIEAALKRREALKKNKGTENE